MPSLLFSMTPPRASHTPEWVAELATAMKNRISALPIDGLILYDIDDETGRTQAQRPFPFSATVDPAVFYSNYLQECPFPVVVYRCVGKYSETELSSWLKNPGVGDVQTVFVGSASAETAPLTSLRRAYELHQAVNPQVPLGAVAIPERHLTSETEHTNMLRKQHAGVSFFVTQVVYDVGAAKSMVSDYFYACAAAGVEPQRIVFTFSVCGSAKTLEFLQWLGVHVPRWMHNTLTHCADPLTESYLHCVEGITELMRFCKRLGQPCGFNIESVSVRKVEIEATVDLARHVGRMLSSPTFADQ